MLRIALERGLSSLIAKWMLDGRADGVLDRVARAGALPPEEIEALRAQTAVRLEKVRAEGAPYADMVTDALGGMRSALPDFAALLRTTDASSARVVAAAVADELARRAAEAARAAAQQWQPAESASAPSATEVSDSESTPADTESAPADNESAPADNESAPADNESAPVERPSLSPKDAT